MMHPRDLLEAMGENADERVADALGLSVRTVRNKAARQFPAAWWPAIKGLCDERGLECPEALFTFRGRAAE